WSREGGFWSEGGAGESKAPPLPTPSPARGEGLSSWRVEAIRAIAALELLSLCGVRGAACEPVVCCPSNALAPAPAQGPGRGAGVGRGSALAPSMHPLQRLQIIPPP